MGGPPRRSPASRNAQSLRSGNSGFGPDQPVKVGRPGGEALHQFMGKARPAKPEQSAGGPITKGRRATTLNAMLIAPAFECRDLNELLYLAHEYNSDFLPPLENTEVVKIATKVWRDKAEGKIEEWKGVASMRKRSRSSPDPRRRLGAVDRNARSGTSTRCRAYMGRFDHADAGAAKVRLLS